METSQAAGKIAVVLIRDDQVATINPALQQAEADRESGQIRAYYPLYVLDDETIAETRPSLSRLHYLLFRLWRLGERFRQQGTRLEFRQGEFGQQTAQYAMELTASRVYTTTDETPLGQRQTERIQKGVEPLELVLVAAREGVMTEEREDFVPYWELFGEEELELMQL